MLAFTPSFITLGVLLISFVASQTSPSSTTDSDRLNFTNGFYSETIENSNSTIMSSTMSYANTNGTTTPWTAQEGNKSEGTSYETTPAPMTTSYIYSTKMKENQKDKNTTTAKPYTTKRYDSTAIIILVLIIVVAIGFGIACYISKRRGRRYAVDFSTRADEANIPLSTGEPVSANDSAPHNGLQTFESGDKRSKEEEKEEAAAKTVEEDEPKDDLQNKAEDAEPVKSDEPDQQISHGTAEASPKNENNSNNADVMERKGRMSDTHGTVKSNAVTLSWWSALCVPMIPGAKLSGALCPWQDHPCQTGPRWGTGQSTAPKTPMMRKIIGSRFPLSRRGSLGPPSGARRGGGARRRAPGGRTCTHGARPGTSRKGNVGPPSHGPTTCRRGHRGRVHCELGSDRRQGPWRCDPRLQKLALGTWNVTSLAGKEPELVCEVENFRLDIVGFASTHSLGSGTSPLKRGWTLSHSGVAKYCPLARRPYIGVHPSGREGSLPPPLGGGTGPGCCLCLCMSWTLG
ncbi:uncharacterized protein si:dkey-27h10.2 isoform X2 [Phyllopteryx taeniolatus]|uniref:uncharacterized protein si:dkey-27h10.2 isoform X2 n=1 Tax=Phyllopteryx taeniolatus TaxID=161469 RepID=UPI002AD48511|nr:uncharacterized protein si:dkey-27h10.2 isoform X2 [Phyllopteryx taeniolatus]